MTRIAESPHVHTLLPDYVLGLLPGDDAHWVAAHLAGCSACRQALASEQAIGRSVKATLARTSIPDRDQLARLAPPALPSASARFGRLPWSSGLATAAIMLLLLFGAVALFAGQGPGSWGLIAPTAGSTTVVLTDTPTQTATQEMTATAEGLGAFSSPEPSRSLPLAGRSAHPAPAMAPVPAAPTLQ